MNDSPSQQFFEAAGEILRINTHAYADPELVALEPIESRLDEVLAHWMCFVVAGGDKLILTVKVFYEHEVVRRFMEFGEIPDGLATDTDFMKEFVNIAAGKLQHAVAAAGVSLAMSIPVTTRGFDEICKPADPMQKSGRWCCTIGDEKLYYAVECTTYEPEVWTELARVEAVAPMSVSDWELL